MRGKMPEFSLIKEEFMNENEITTCLIKINGKTIPFTYCYRFKDKGKYTKNILLRII